MMKTLLFFLLIPCSMLLAGCVEREVFGMPESQFHSLTDEQKQEVIRAYNEREMQRTINEPMNNLIGVAGDAVKSLNKKDKRPKQGSYQPAPMPEPKDPCPSSDPFVCEHYNKPIPGPSF